MFKYMRKETPYYVALAILVIAVLALVIYDNISSAVPVAGTVIERRDKLSCNDGDCTHSYFVTLRIDGGRYEYGVDWFTFNAVAVDDRVECTSFGSGGIFRKSLAFCKVV